MTDFELSQYRCLKLEQKILEHELAELSSMCSTSSWSTQEKTAPTNSVSKTVENYAVKHADLALELESAMDRTVSMRRKIEDFISGIADADIRTMIRLYYVHDKTWLQVGIATGRDGSWARRLVLDYLEGKQRLFY